MLSHIRGTYDATKHPNQHKLKNFFAVMTREAAPPMAKARRAERLGPRQSPFMNLRSGSNTGTEEDDEHDDNDGSESVVVTKYYDPTNRHGVMLMGDR